MARFTRTSYPNGEGWHTTNHCPVCNVLGFRSIKRIGGELIGHCRRGHPYSLEPVA
jgi:hypothetical protein